MAILVVTAPLFQQQPIFSSSSWIASLISMSMCRVPSATGTPLTVQDYVGLLASIKGSNLWDFQLHFYIP